MSHKRIFMLLFILSILLLSITGCTYLQEYGIIPSQPEKTKAQPEAQPKPEKPPEQHTSVLLPATQKILKLSHAPRVGETAEVTLTIIRSFPEPISVRAWLEFSRVDASGSYGESQKRVNVAPQEILLQGDLNWEGIATLDTPLEFRTDIKFPEEGIWEITGYIQGRGNPSRSNRVRLAVQTDRAGIYGSEAYEKGELEWMKDYSPNMAVRLDSPVTATLNLSKPPKLDEPAELTWSIASTKNVAEAKVWIEFKLMEPGATKPIKLPGESVLVEGSLQWEGTLEKAAIVSSSAIVAFPEEGDWEIVLLFDDSESRYGCSNIFLNVTEERGRWGWAESHEFDSSQVPPPTPAPKPGE